MPSPDYHRTVRLRLLTRDSELAIPGDQGPGHHLIEGDNLEALKALLPRYRGQVSCIYIDPPYNTGNEGWAYNDAVNSPAMRDWLGRVVGRDDLTRHDKWLCMMYPRLVLLRELLADDGCLLVSIDDTEVANLQLLLEEIFGVDNRVGTIVWRNVTDNNPTNISIEHEYVVCFARDRNRLPSVWKSDAVPVKRRLIDMGQEFIAAHSEPKELSQAYSTWFREHKDELWPFQDYKFIDAGGIYTGSRSVHNPGKDGYRYDVLHPRTGRPCRLPLMGYRFPEGTMRELLRDRKILFGDDESKLVELKLYVHDYRAKLPSVIELDTRMGTNEIKSIFPESKRPFDFPKPSELIADLLSFTTKKDSVVLDCFAGSGTTGHAIMRLNAQDGGHRRCLLIQLGQDQTGGVHIARDITHERLRRVSAGYTSTKGEAVPGLNQAWTYSTLGEPFTDDLGRPRVDLPFADLAPIVFHHATGEALAGVVARRAFLGVSRGGDGVYLLYNGDMDDKDARSGNVLTRAMLARLTPHTGRRIVYGAACRLEAEELRRANLVFRQYPQALMELGA